MSNRKFPVTVMAESPRSADAADLIARLTAELGAMYGRDGGASAFKPEDVEGADGAFMVARDEAGKAIGCGAIRPHEEETAIAEIKRMFVDPEVRGRGVGRALIVALEREAIRLGYSGLILETGDRQTEANFLYPKMGFERCACWGKYASDPISLCYRKAIL